MSLCPLMQIDIVMRESMCPVGRCIYRANKSNQCLYSLLGSNDEMTLLEVSQATKVEYAEVERLAKAGLKRIQIALAIDAYLDTLSDIRKKTVNNDVPSVLRIFGLHTDDLPKVLNKDRYQKWKNRSGVDITYDEIHTLLNLR